MVWFYERSGRFIRCESREAEKGAGYELVIMYPDGRQDIEMFDDPIELNRRQLQLEHELATGGWLGPHGRIV